jgi:hypothetical protein
MFDRDERPTNAVSRPGALRPANVRDCASVRPPADCDKTRLVLIEGGFYEVLDALHASSDEAFDGLIRAIDRLAGHAPAGRSCPQCGRITVRTTRVCSETCQRFYESEITENQPRRRRKACGTLI